MTKFILRSLSVAIILAFIAITAVPMISESGVAFAQDAADTPTTEPAAPATSTPVPANAPSDPAQIPEPVTVILFGSGLAALSASVAKKRKKQ